MGQLMKSVKNCPAVLERNEGTWRGEGDVAKNPNVAELDQLQLEGRNLGGLNRWARALGGGDS